MLLTLKTKLQQMPREHLLFHLLLACLTVYQLAVTVSSYRTGQFYTHDIGHIDYMFYHTWHGKFFWSIVYDAPHFSIHFTPTLLLLVPVHALFRHMLLIPLLETLALCTGAWATAWMFSGILRRSRRFGPAFSTLGLAAGLFYLGSPLIGSIQLAYHFESFATCLMLWGIAALVNGRSKLFWLFWLLAIGVKEDIALYGVAFGLWLLIFQRWSLFPAIKRQRRFAWVLIAVCVGWFALAMGGISLTAYCSGRPLSEHLQYYAPNADSDTGLLDAYLGRFSETVAHIRQMTPILLHSVLWLAALEPIALLLLIPPALIMGLSENYPQFDLLFYYSYPFIPFLYLGVCLGLARLLHWSRRFGFKKSAPLSLIVIISLTGAVMLTLPTRTEEKRRVVEAVSRDQQWLVRTLRQEIPRQASVAAQYNLLCYLPRRTEMYPLSKESIGRAQYWVIDVRGHLGEVRAAEIRQFHEIAKELQAEGRAEITLLNSRLIIVEVLDFDSEAPGFDKNRKTAFENK